MSRFSVLLIICVFALAICAQTPDTATVHGQVVDQSHAAVSDVQVVLKNTQSGLERKARTDAAGTFSMEGLPVAGAYELTASKSGFADAQLKHVMLQGGATADLNVQLNIASGQSQVVVTGVVGEVRADQPQIGTYFSATDAEETPLLNRRITFLPMLNAANRPAINQGDVFMNENLFTTNGAGRREAWYMVDG
jgi:hypothetical protein